MPWMMVPEAVPEMKIPACGLPEITLRSARVVPPMRLLLELVLTSTPPVPGVAPGEGAGLVYADVVAGHRVPAVGDELDPVEKTNDDEPARRAVARVDVRPREKAPALTPSSTMRGMPAKPGCVVASMTTGLVNAGSWEPAGEIVWTPVPIAKLMVSLVP